MKKRQSLLKFIVGTSVILSSPFAFSMGKSLPGETPEAPSPLVQSVLITPQASTADSTPLWESKIAGSKAWTSHLSSSLDSLGKDILDVIPSDSGTFCANYKNLNYNQRKDVWMFLISYMTKFESNFNVNSTYTEAFADRVGKRVVSRGLLQISIESGNAYGCNFKKSADLHDPYQNLDCGVRILNRWLNSDGRIAGKVGTAWKGGARYWSVLRTTSKSYASIASGVNKLSICQK